MQVTYHSWFSSEYTLELEGIGGANYKMWSAHACSLDGSGHSTSGSIFPTQTPTGVELEVEHSRTEGEQQDEVEEVLAIPFGKSVDGRKGRIAYSAQWVLANDRE